MKHNTQTVLQKKEGPGAFVNMLELELCKDKLVKHFCFIDLTVPILFASKTNSIWPH